MKAIGLYVVVKPIKEADKTTKGGLLMTDKVTSDIRYKIGEVVSAGGDVEKIKTGDLIYYDRHAGFNIEVNKELFLVLKIYDIPVIL